jgi:hypothetical protein
MPTTRDNLAQRLGGKREVAIEQVARAHAQVKLPRKLRDADVADYVVVHPGISKIQPRMQRRAEELVEDLPVEGDELASKPAKGRFRNQGRSPVPIARETWLSASTLLAR